LLQAVDVSFAYGDATVLRDASFRIREGALVGLLGPNGSGKTTLLRLLSAVLAPTAGRVLLDGARLDSIPRRQLARRIAVVPQDTQLTFDYRVLDVALMGRHPYLGPFEFEGPPDLRAAFDALEVTGTRALAHRRSHTLSGGERQRVVIAGALAQLDARSLASPDTTPRTRSSRRVLLLDEPTASLDLRYQLELAAVLLRLHAHGDLTIVVCTHDLNFAASICEELILLRDGTVLAQGATDVVLTREAVRSVYGVEADVSFHRDAGHLTVVPITSLRSPVAVHSADRPPAGTT
jgi:iron complex transport system ATP-binding protein